jgi:hypothetical protein
MDNDQPRAGPSSPRRSPGLPLRSLKSSDALSPELPPTYNSLDTHVQPGGDKDTDHLITKSKPTSRSSREGDEDDELDALRLDLDGIGDRPERDGGTGAMISVDQRKALWWKNTLITGLFVASW